MKPVKIGLIRETKTPPDRRVAFPPDMAAELLKKYPDISIVVETSNIRCYEDAEYTAAGITLSEDLSDCDILLGIKEVKPDHLIPGKTYLFFAHVAKEQAYNRELLRDILNKKITLIDYEYLTDRHGVRLIAFGRWAGIVGAYNGLRAWGIRSGRYHLKPAHECHDFTEMKNQLQGLDTGHVRILVTGGGRVAKGAMEVLELLDIKAVSPEKYLSDSHDDNAICRIDPWHYAARKDGKVFNLSHFFAQPENYHSIFYPYARKTDLMIAGHYWDPQSPRLWELNQMNNRDFRIRVIADISCDIGGAIPCNLRASTIAEPFYGFDPITQTEKKPFGDHNVITMMTIDNLPGELPRDSSADFASVLGSVILPKIMGDDTEGVICRATITHNGELTQNFRYLEHFVNG